MDSQDHKVKVEYGVSAVVLLTGVFFVFLAFTIETSREAVGPRTMPLFLAVSLVISGLWLALRAFLGRAGDLKEGYGFLESDIARIAMVVGSGVVFLVMFWGFGYFAAIIVTYIIMLYSFGVRSWGWMIGGAVVVACIFQWLFMGVMLLNDPAGALMDVRPFTDWIKGA